MPTTSMKSAMLQLREALLRDAAGLTDCQLLDSIVAGRDEGAFETIVRRHGPMVMGVCRRILGSVHDAEDAFQAVFLVLARKAASISRRELLANWLYGVAQRTSLAAKGKMARRRSHEIQVNDMPQSVAKAPAPRDDWLPLLDAELSKLPDKYRIPIVLCDLECRTRHEAAQQLKIPEGTLSSRLATARKLLAHRLARHGSVFSGGALAATLAQNAASAAVPATVISVTAAAAANFAAGKVLPAGGVSAQVTALAEGVLKAMLLTKLKIATLVLLVAAFVGGGIGAAVLPALQAKPADRTAPVVFLGGNQVPKTAAQPAAKEGRIYFWLDQRLASVQPDGKDFKWHSKRMVNSSGLPNVAHLGDLRVSPDGQRVAFCMGGVRVKNDVDKTDTEVKMRVLTLDKEEPIIDLGRYANGKVWSADGAKLACSFVEYDETEDRFHRSNWIIDVKTKKKTALELPAGHLVMDWSADGNWFLTSAEINAKEAKVKPARQSTHVSQIYLVKRDGSEVRALTDLEFSATEGRFSPDGRMILFHGRDPKGDTWHIHALDLKERKPWKVSQELDGGVGGACWSPDGKRIAYVYGKTSDEKGDGFPEILFRQAEHFLMVADADGKNSATLKSEKNQVLRITLRAADWR
jgi:RNA polymerase sigma factor (sigma-70 family)